MKCRDCKGKKTYVGAGMYAPESCHHCRGTGEEPVDGGELAKQLLKREREVARAQPGPTVGGDITLHSGTTPERGGKLRPAGTTVQGLSDYQEGQVLAIAQGVVRDAVEPLKLQIGALQQEVARLREPRGMPNEHVISDIAEIEPGATRRIALRPTNANSNEPYALQRMVVAAMPVDLVDTNGENIELPVVIECAGTTLAQSPILLADVVSTAGMFEVTGLFYPASGYELIVQVKNPTTEKVRVTVAAWVIQKQPEPFDPFFNHRRRYGR